MAKMKPLGKIIITKINVKESLKPKKIILGEDVEKSLQEEDAIKDAEFYTTLTVVAVGSDVRPEIKAGSKIIIPSNKLNYLDRIVYKGVPYHTILDSESTVPVVLE